MTNEEIYLRKVMGSENHFRVPDGYFDSLPGQIMAMLPEKEAQQPQSKETKRARIVSMRPWLYAAASAVIAVGFFALWKSNFTGNTAQPQPQQVATVATNDNYLDEVADYAMFDNQDIYACLTSDL